MCVSSIFRSKQTINTDADIPTSNFSYYQQISNSSFFKNIIKNSLNSLGSIKNILNPISRFFTSQNRTESSALKETPFKKSTSKTATHSKKIFDIKELSCKSIDKTATTSIETAPKSLLIRASKNFLSLLDFIFVKHLIHAKACDITVLVMFAFIVLASAISIAAPHLTLLNFALLGQLYVQPAFGILNVTVGLAVGVQSIKNLKKAIQTKNKEEIVIAIISVFYSMAIATTGAVAFANFSNDILLKSLFTICAGFGLGIGSYNFLKTQRFKRQLKIAQDKNEVKEFFRRKITISKNEIDTLKTKIETLSPNEVDEKLRKNLSKIEFEIILKKGEVLKKQKLLDLELKIIRKRKTAKLEKILRSKITKNIKEFTKSSKNEDKDLNIAIHKELNIRTIAETLRVLAPSLSIAAFGINQMSTFATSEIQNLVYYSMMLTSKLSGFWLNYVPSWRNVPCNDKKVSKTIKTSQKFFTKKPIQAAS